MSEDIKDVLRTITLEVMTEFDERIKALSEHILELDANYMAIVTLLSEKRVLSTDEFDQKQEELLNEMKSKLEKVKKLAVKSKYTQ